MIELKHVRLTTVALLLAGCGGGSGIPSIESFSATPSQLPAGGGTVTLAWRVSGASSLSIEPNIGTVSGSSLVVAVNSSRTFTMTARGAGGTATATAAVAVEGSVDTTAPSVLSSSPSSGATGVGRDAVIALNFSEPMNKSTTQGAYQSSSPGIRANEVAFEWNSEATTLTIRPSAPLPYAAGSDPATLQALSFSFSLANTATDLAGNKLLPISISFKTLRQITARLKSDPAQDGSVDGSTVNNGNFDLNVTTTSRGFVSFSLAGLPAGLQPSSVASAALRINAQFPMVFSTELVELEHLIYGSTLTASAATTAALRNLGYLSQEPPIENAWKTANVLTAVRDDLGNRLARSNRSQYRLRCTGCSVTFFSGEAVESGGDARFKAPELVVEFLQP
ncbi:MAG: Ig-like domain-containing protein [Meiothermus sp.]|nr:Ig-like domain-containing protein [Meiothermus sp.]